MGVGSGIASQLVMVQEVTWGTTPSLATARALEFNDEKLKLDKKVIQSKGLHAGGQDLRRSRRAVVSRQASGDISLDVPTEKMGLLWMACMGSWGTVATQIGATGAWKQVHLPGPVSGSTAKSLSIQKGVPAIDGTTIVPFTYNGVQVTEFELSAKVDEFLGLKATFDAQDERTPSSVPTPGPALATAVYSTLEAGMFHFAQGALYSGGTVSFASGQWSVAGNVEEANVMEFSVKSTNPQKTDRIFLNTEGLKDRQIDNDFRDRTGNMKAEFQGVTQYERFRNDTELVLVLEFKGPVIGSATEQATLQILLPSVSLDGDTPQIGGPDVVEISSPFTAEQPVSGAPAMQLIYTSTDITV
jgi:hypothetical protein